MKWLFLLMSVFAILKLPAQDKPAIPNKIPPTLYESKKLNQDKAQNFFLVTDNMNRLKQFLSEKGLGKNIIAEYQLSNLLIVRTNWTIIDSMLIPSSLIKFVDIVRVPKEETIIDGFDLGVNQLNLTHNQFKTINGNSTVVSVKENKPDTNDTDLKGRFIFTPIASSTVTSHATIMSTIIAGGGNSFITGKGAAWGASITSSDFANLLPDADPDYKKYSISVQNHSYGTAIENYYGADAAAYDASTISIPSLLHVFSAGNSGDKTSTAGPYTGVAGFANLTGSFKMAKNIITVGAIDGTYQVSILSSKGPTYDGRVRPELVAFGQDGSSGAAALVSGTALLLQQSYKETNGGQPAPSALIKCVLLNSADDVGPKEIDFQSGYGSLNAYNAMHAVVNKRYFTGVISNGELRTHLLNLPANIRRLKITICWNDLPADPNSQVALINDIDLRLVHTASGNSWQPWVLSTSAHPDSLTKMAIRTRDSLNNVEQVTIDNPLAGTYSLDVTGYHIERGPQSYYISYQWDSINQFEWRFPTASDQLYANSDATLRWESTFTGSTGELYHSLDGGSTWKLISGKVDLSRSYLQWSAPNTFTPVMFRMIVNGQSFVSDESMISSRLVTNVGFNCSDSFSIHWNKVPPVSSYTVYRLGDQYLEPLLSTTDTGVVLKKSNNLSLHYAVAPNVQGKPAIRSYAFNYSTQGVGCYIRNFLVDLANTNVGNVFLGLGTTYNVKDVIIEELSRNGFVPIQAISNPSFLDHRLTDTTLLKGGNSYRARLNLMNGQVIYSQVETIYYLPGINYLVFPNPATTSFQVVSKDDDNTELILYNATGQKVLTKRITSPVQKISIHQLQKGIYFIVILQKNKAVYQGNLLVQ